MKQMGRRMIPCRGLSLLWRSDPSQSWPGFPRTEASDCLALRLMHRIARARLDAWIELLVPFEVVDRMHTGGVSWKFRMEQRKR